MSSNLIELRDWLIIGSVAVATFKLLPNTLPNREVYGFMIIAKVANVIGNEGGFVSSLSTFYRII